MRPKEFRQLEIDPEFKALIRPLRREEYRQLELNLSIDGCREPLVAWGDIIVDGHNRYEICNRLLSVKLSLTAGKLLLHGSAATNWADAT